jgi:hypothetical protein
VQEIPFMTERLLQFIWQFQHYNKSELTTIAGEPVLILFPGQYNTNQGPDFSNARIVIEETTWVGSVELHILSSDWNRHRHESDQNYHNVILHVVWEHDTGLKEQPERNIPLVELKSRVPKILLQRYTALMQSRAFIPCENIFPGVNELAWKNWIDRLITERLTRKAAIVGLALEASQFHWEEVFWWTMAKNFGMTVNGEAFEMIARSLPLSMLTRHKHQIHQLEALLLGQAGLLDKDFEDDYPRMLRKEYRFLQKKYGLQPIAAPVFALRMRPGNFPAVRLAELAMLIHTSERLFTGVKDAVSPKEIRKLFDVTANDYWHYHYQLDTKGNFIKKKTGAAMQDSLLINTVAPVLFSYGGFHKEAVYRQRAMDCLEEAAPENNSITRGFKNLGAACENARDSQALIELRNEYCNKRRCLECVVGNALLK